MAFEVVDAGFHKLTVNVHWELLPGGGDDRGFGAFSVGVTTDGDCG